MIISAEIMKQLDDDKAIMIRVDQLNGIDEWNYDGKDVNGKIIDGDFKTR